jgi:hypothetical protein
MNQIDGSPSVRARNLSRCPSREGTAINSRHVSWDVVDSRLSYLVVRRKTLTWIGLLVDETVFNDWKTRSASGGVQADRITSVVPGYNFYAGQLRKELVRGVALHEDSAHSHCVRFVAKRTQIIEGACQLVPSHLIGSMRVHIPLQLEAEACRVVMRFVGPCEEAPTRWSSRDTDISQPSTCIRGVERGQCHCAWSQGVKRPHPGAASVRTASLIRAGSGNARCIASSTKCRGDSVRTVNSFNRKCCAEVGECTCDVITETIERKGAHAMRDLPEDKLGVVGGC